LNSSNSCKEAQIRLLPALFSDTAQPKLHAHTNFTQIWRSAS